MDKREKLIALKKKMLADEILPLRAGATNLVFGEGSADAKVFFLGEGPGFWEDQKARPFVGRAGEFLNQLLQSIKLDRKIVFITNVVNYRPPENRDPTPEEIDAFRPYIDEMINIIKPSIIVTLGRFSMAKFLPNVKISQIHGKEQKVVWLGREVVVFPMYHPAAALRNPIYRTHSIEDFQKLPLILELIEKEEKDAGNKTKSEQMSLV